MDSKFRYNYPEHRRENLRSHYP